MYKRIVHSIIEEHYDHPIAAELQQQINKNSRATATIDYMGRVIDPITGKPAIDPRTGEFVYANTNIIKPKFGDTKKTKEYEIYTYPVLKQIEKDSITAWSLLNWRIRSLVISVTEGDEDIDLLMKRAASDIDMISNLLVPVYGASAAKKFNELLYKIVESLVNVLMRIKAGRDSSDEMSTLKDDTQSFAEFVYKANPMWMSDVVIDIFTRMENLYIAQAKARLKKEWADGVKAADDAYNLMVVKQDNGDASFADIYAAGIIADTVIEEVEDFMGT